ncbi:MAG: lysophospholipid acyltransferase family protein [Caulobacteraceae bacterium]|nr:lysophospholipid acyltransferase family protein [Caulobacteraceae bacterium]
MKQVLRNAGVQAFLGWVLTGYLRMALATIRWRHVNVETVEPVLAGESGAIALFWHGRIPLCLATAPQWWRKRTRAMISPSADGEFIAQALARVGFPAIRMSSAKPGDAAKARQAAIGFREAVTWTEGGGALVITPDGPRGPNEVIAPGALQIAKRSGAPVFLMGIAAAPALQMKTWDKVMWAAPFGRGAVVWDGPHVAPRDIGPAEGEAMLADWSARLSAATRRAEAIVRGEAD